MIEDETDVNQSAWQRFERMHRIKLINNRQYLKGYTPAFRAHYIDQSLKALHQIAKEDCFSPTIEPAT